MLISEKVEFQTKNTTKDKQEHYITIKESIFQEYTTIQNIYALKKRVTNMQSKNRKLEE